VPGRARGRRLNGVAFPVEIGPRLITEVLPGLYMLRTFGSNCFLIVEDTLTLIDTGARGSGQRVLNAVKALGRSPDEIANILITHYHVDHVGGLAEIQRHVPARTGVHLLEADQVANADLPNPFQHPTLAKVMQPFVDAHHEGERPRVDVVLEDGDELPVLGGLRVVHAPGHTAGSITLHFPNRGALIVGDAMQYKFGRLMLPSKLFTEDMRAARSSIRKLATLDFDVLCFSHFRPIVSDASRAVRLFARSLEPAVAAS
jgi:glyoxylase-like metal-dependent hydrolase (beta-lactamase superfamily II)